MTTFKNIYYSERYSDDENEYRHVIIPKELIKKLPKDRYMTEEEWRALGIQQSPGWIHYMAHKPEPHVLMFKRPKS
ncbi:cyclin-dependent kinases regulatory subunit-like [Clytia hemisphaerica]|uniref:cyclin-dependent kinases regulatory subunit-like n=1 Tax=Clytia hemisphaerica TaxID=252671 RepID=UPI0034D7A022